MLTITVDDTGKSPYMEKGEPPARDGTGSEKNRLALTERHRNQILYEWNNTRADFPDICTHELFQQQVSRDPDAIAVVGGEKSLTYRELNGRANQVAHYLRRRGVGGDVLVGVCLQRSVEMVVALLGVWKSGGAYVPLDSSYPEERLSFMVSDAAVQILLTEERFKHLFTSIRERVVCLDSDWPAIALEDNSDPNSGITPSNLAYVMYTSGSTGTPKGVMIPHRGLVNYLWWAVQKYNVQAGGSVPVHSSISFDLTVTSLFPVLVSGGQVELLAEDVGAQNLLAALRRTKDRNLVKITPAHLEALSRQLSAEEVAGMTQLFVIGGENLLAESLRLWRDSAPATRLINEYGPTETVVGCCVYEVQPEDRHNGPIPIGRPISNTQLYILDESMEPVPPGVMGELYIGGAGVARGYLNRPDLTRERFLPDHFSGQSNARMYKTGDLARYREDGVIEYLGRNDNQVKVRGYRIELGEIEAALTSCPAIQSSVVVAREDSSGDKQLVAYLVSQESKQPAAEELQNFMRSKLPEYMIPARFVYLESFPLTHNGKIDRKALPAPLFHETPSVHESARPRTVTEEAIATIWMDMFKISNIGIHDDFFELGGYSLSAIRMMARIRDEIGVELPVLSIYENPTIAALADSLTKAGAVDVAADIDGLASPVHDAQEGRQQDGPRTMKPFYFGSADAPLFGVYSAPSAVVARQSAVLLCAPIGLEYMRTHYALRLVASQLAKKGIHVLRFDYHGTGDSSGNVGAGQFELWCDDIAVAASKLLEISGVQDLTIVGLRLGAALAVEAVASREIKAKGLVLWDPVVSGSEYLSKLEKMHTKMAAKRKVPLQPTDELLGTCCPRDLRAAIQGIDLVDRLHKVDVRGAALVVSGGDQKYAPLLNSLWKRWPETMFRPMGEPVDWDSLQAAYGGRMTGPITRVVAETVESMS